MLNQIDLSRADLNLLVLFEIVLDERHVGRAAQRLDLSASAVSHGLGRLRRLLGDPLFLRTPKGVVPTARATELAEPIADILARVRSVVSTAEPFDPKTSTRRFTIGAPDGVSAVVLPALLAALDRVAPTVDISVRQLLPPHGIAQAERAWQPALDDLEARAIDIAIVPLRDVPADFARQASVQGGVRGRRARGTSLRQAADPRSVLPDAASAGVAHRRCPWLRRSSFSPSRVRSRRIALTVPNFMMALAIIAETDLIAALPGQLVAMHAERFGVVGVEPPVPLRSDEIRAVVSKAALMDAGVAWLFGVLHDSHPVRRIGRRRRA